jgi:hypothetical protein
MLRQEWEMLEGLPRKYSTEIEFVKSDEPVIVANRFGLWLDSPSRLGKRLVIVAEKSLPISQARLINGRSFDPRSESQLEPVGILPLTINFYPDRRVVHLGPYRMERQPASPWVMKISVASPEPIEYEKFSGGVDEVRDYVKELYFNKHQPKAPEAQLPLWKILLQKVLK